MGGCFLFNRVSRPIIPLHKEELMKKEVDLFYVNALKEIIAYHLIKNLIYR